MIILFKISAELKFEKITDQTYVLNIAMGAVLLFLTADYRVINSAVYVFNH